MITRLFLLALPAIVLLSGCGTRIQKFITVPQAETIKVTPVDPDTYEERYGKYDGVYLLTERSLHHYGNGRDIRFARTHRIRYVILDPNAEWLSTASYSFDPEESLTTFYSIVTSPEGVSRLFTIDDLIAERASDGSSRYKIAYPDVRRGTIIEEAFQTEVDVESDPQTTHAAMLQYSIPADTVRFRIEYPAWWTLKVKKTDSVRPPLFETPSWDNDGLVSIGYETHRVPALSREPYSPYHKEQGLYFEGAFTRMLTNRGRYEAAGSWNHVGSTMFGNMMPTMPRFEQIETTTKRIVGSITEPRKIVDAIASWLQDSIRPARFDEVDSELILEKRSGNVLAINELALSMLDVAGVQSQLYFIHSAEDGYFDPDFIDMRQFDILACAAIVDSTPVVFFPHLRNIPVGYIPGPYRGESALALNRVGSHEQRLERLRHRVYVANGGYSAHGIVRLPDDEKSISTTEESIVATLDESGDVMIEERRVMNGGVAIDMRDELDEMTEEETRKSMQELIGTAEGDLKLESYEITNLAKRNDPLEITLRYRASNALTITPEEIVFHTGGLLAPSSESHWKIDSTERKSAIAIYTGRHLRKQIRIVYPKEWRLQTPLSNQLQENRFGEVLSSYSQQDGELSATMTSILERSRGAREDIAELRQLISARSTLAVPTLVFSR